MSADTVKIAILDDYPGIALSLADWTSLDSTITVFRDTVTDFKAARDRLLPFDVVCHMPGRTALDSRLINDLPALKLIVSSEPTGADVDITAAWGRGITVCKVERPQASHAEQTLAMLLSLTRRIEAEARAMRRGAWQSGVGTRLAGLEMGLIGFDDSGETMSQVARALGMSTTCWSPTWSPLELTACGVQPYQDLAEVFAGADIVSVHLPVEESGAAMIGEEEFRLMRPGSIFINTSHGTRIDWRGLLEAMDLGRPAQAALDVFDEEPLPPNHPLRQSGLIEEGRLLLTPNMGAFTRESLEVMFAQMVDCIGAWKAGIPIQVIRPI